MQRNDMIHYFRIVLQARYEKKNKHIVELKNIAQTLYTEIAEMKTEDIEYMKTEIQKVYMYIYSHIHAKLKFFVLQDKQYVGKLEELERVYAEAGKGKLEEVREFFGTDVGEETVLIYFFLIQDIKQRKYAGFELKERYNIASPYKIEKKRIAEDIEDIDYLGDFKLKKKIWKEVQNWQKVVAKKEKNIQEEKTKKIWQNLYFATIHDEGKGTYTKGYFSARFLYMFYQAFGVFYGSILYIKSLIEMRVLRIGNNFSLEKIGLVFSFVFALTMMTNTNVKMYIYSHFHLPFVYFFPFVPIAPPTFLMNLVAISFLWLYFYICLMLVLSLIGSFGKLGIAMMMKDNDEVGKVGNAVLGKIGYLIVIVFFFSILRK